MNQIVLSFLSKYSFMMLPFPPGSTPKLRWNGVVVSLKAPGTLDSNYTLIDSSNTVVARIPLRNNQLTGYCILGALPGHPLFCGTIENGEKNGFVEEYPSGRDSYLARYENGDLVSVLFRYESDSDLYCEISLAGDLLFIETIDSRSRALYGTRYEYYNNKIARAYNVDKEYYSMEFDDDTVWVRNSYGDVIYTGEYLDNVFANYCYHGEGELVLEDDCVYKGEFRYGKRCGKGVVYKNNMVLFSSEWVDDKPHGKGVLYKNGVELMKATFDHGDIVNSDGEKTKYKVPNPLFPAQTLRSEGIFYERQRDRWWYTAPVKQRLEEINAPCVNTSGYTVSLQNIGFLRYTSTRRVSKVLRTEGEYQHFFGDVQNWNDVQSLEIRAVPCDTLAFPPLSTTLETLVIGKGTFCSCKQLWIKNLPSLKTISIESNCFSNVLSYSGDCKVEISELIALISLQIGKNSFCSFNYLFICSTTWQ